MISICWQFLRSIQVKCCPASHHNIVKTSTSFGKLPKSSLQYQLDAPDPRFSHTFTKVSDKHYVLIGGLEMHGRSAIGPDMSHLFEFSAVEGSAYIWNIETLKWVQSYEIIWCRAFHTANYVDSSQLILIIGGVDSTLKALHPTQLTVIGVSCDIKPGSYELFSSSVIISECPTLFLAGHDCVIDNGVLYCVGWVQLEKPELDKHLGLTTKALYQRLSFIMIGF